MMNKSLHDKKISMRRIIQVSRYVKSTLNFHSPVCYSSAYERVRVASLLTSFQVLGSISQQNYSSLLAVSCLVQYINFEGR